MRPPAERHFLALKAREGRTPGRDKAVPANRVRQGSGTQRSRASSQRGKMSRWSHACRQQSGVCAKRTEFVGAIRNSV